MRKIISFCITFCILISMFCFTSFSASAKRISISINTTKATVLKGKTCQLYAKSNIKSKFRWTTSKKNVVTISKSKTKSGEKITAKGKNVGTSVVKATAQDGSKLSLSCKVTVINKPRLSKSKLYLYNSDKVYLRVKGGSGKITWSSSNKSVATVNSAGFVVANKGGKCYIYAKRNGYTMKCTVKVGMFDPTFKNVYDFGAVNGVQIYKMSDDSDSDYMILSYQYDLSGRNVNGYLNNYVKKINSKGFYYSNTEHYYYGDTDYYYDSMNVQVAITNYGDSLIEISMLAKK